MLVQQALMDNQVPLVLLVLWVLKVPMEQLVQWAMPVRPACRVLRVRLAQSAHKEHLVLSALQVSLVRPVKLALRVVKAVLAQ